MESNEDQAQYWFKNELTLLILNFRVWTLKPYETKHLNPAALHTLRFTKNPRIIIEHNVLAEKIESRHTIPPWEREPRINELQRRIVHIQNINEFTSWYANYYQIRKEVR